MQKLTSIKLNDSLFTFLGSAIAAYVILKILCLGITDDEAWSYYNVKRFWYVETLCTGNTHWFNFLAIKTALLLGLEKAWQLRWLTALSSLVFIFIGITWIKEIKTTYLKLFAFAFLFLNPYLLDYLSLARGYANALAFMAISLFFLYKSFGAHVKTRQLRLALWFAGFSAIANFNFFYFFTAFSVLYFFNVYFKNGFSWIKNRKFYFDFLYSLSVAFLVLRALLFITKCSNDIGGCGGEQFVESVFGSFILKVFGTFFSLDTAALSLVTYIFFIVIMFACSYTIFKTDKNSNQFYTWTGIIFLIMLLLTVINKWSFHVLYPIHRTTLMFFPLFILVVIGSLQKQKNENKVLKYIVYLLLLLLSISFFVTIKLTQTQDYKKQSDSKSVYESLINLKAKNIGICPELYVLYLKYYSQICPELKGQMINTIIPIPVWLKKQDNTLANFNYLILYPPYDVSFYKGSNVALEGICLYPDTKTLIVKVNSLKDS